MIKVIIAGYEPVELELHVGNYLWCACGRSSAQPFCDGSHAGSGIKPVPFTVKKGIKNNYCMCKQTCTPPYCNNNHKALLTDVEELDPPECNDD